MLLLTPASQDRKRLFSLSNEFREKQLFLSKKKKRTPSSLKGIRIRRGTQTTIRRIKKDKKRDSRTVQKLARGQTERGFSIRLIARASPVSEYQFRGFPSLCIHTDTSSNSHTIRSIRASPTTAQFTSFVPAASQTSATHSRLFPSPASVVVTKPRAIESKDAARPFPFAPPFFVDHSL